MGYEMFLNYIFVTFTCSIMKPSLQQSNKSVLGGWKTFRSARKGTVPLNCFLLQTCTCIDVAPHVTICVSNCHFYILYSVLSAVPCAMYSATETHWQQYSRLEKKCNYANINFLSHLKLHNLGLLIQRSTSVLFIIYFCIFILKAADRTRNHDCSFTKDERSWQWPFVVEKTA